MPLFTFNVKMFATIQVNAANEQVARRAIDAIDGNEANLGSWPDGSPILAEVGLDGDHDLVEVEED